MSAFLGVSVSDPWLQSQFTQVQLRNLESKYLSVRNESGHVTLGDLPPVMLKLKNFSELFRERDIKAILSESTSDMNQEVDYESFLQDVEVLLKWMNFQLKQAGYAKEVTSFSSDLKVRKI